MNRKQITRKYMSFMLAAVLAITSCIIPGQMEAFAAWVDDENDIFDINTNIFEIQFTLEYTQYLDLAVYAGEGVREENADIEPVGYIFKMLEVKGDKVYSPQPYRSCSADPGHEHDGASTDMEYRVSPYPQPAGWIPVFSIPEDLGISDADGENEEGNILPGPGGDEKPDEDIDEEYSPSQNANSDPVETDIQPGEEVAGSSGGETGGNSEETIDASAEEKTQPKETLGFLMGQKEEVNTGESDDVSGGDKSTVDEGTGPQGGDDSQSGSDVDNDENLGSREESSTNEDGVDDGERKNPVAESDGGKSDEEKKSDVEEDPAAVIDLPPQAEVISVRQLTKAEWLQEQLEKRKLSAFSAVAAVLDFESYIEFVPYNEPDEDGHIGHNVLYWDGRYDLNAGDSTKEPDYFPAVGPEMDQDRHAVSLEFQFIGYPWKNQPPACTGSGDQVIHRPGENWEWTSHKSFRVRSNVYVIDYRLGEYLKIGQDELQGCIYDFLMDYLNGYIDFDELVFNIDEGDPVNMVSGSYHFQYTDLELFGDWPLKWIRMYNSLDQNDSSGLGKGFSHIYDYTLIDDKGIIRIEGPYGQKMVFLREPDGAGGDLYRSLQDTGFSLKSSDRSTYVMTHNKTDSEFKLQDGRLVQIANPGGYVIAELDYNGDQLVKVSNDWGDSFDLYWSGGQIAAMTDSAGRSISYSYETDSESGLGLLTGMQNPDGDWLNYSYEEGYLISQTSFRGEVYLENSYDDQGRVIGQVMYTDGGSTSMSVKYDEEEGVNTVRTFDGEEKKYHYDEYGMLQYIEDDTGRYTNTWTDQYQAASRSSKDKEGAGYSFDEDGNVVAATYQDENEIKATYENGRIVLRKYKGGGEETFKYDSYGNLIEYKDRIGNITTYTYTRGLMTSVTDPDGFTRRYEYDGKGRKTAEVDPLGNRTEYKYNQAGMMETITAPDGGVTTYTYTDGGKLSSVENALGYTMYYTYDADGNKISETDYRGNTEETEYGQMALPVKTVDREENVTHYTYTREGYLESKTDGKGQKTSYIYDKKGQLISTIDHEGGKITYEYDDLGRLSAMIDQEEHKETYEYDVMGRRSRTVDKDGRVTKYEYDYDGNLIREIREGDDEDAVTQYQYDYVGQLKKVTDPVGGETQFTYNGRGLLIKEIDAEGRETAYTYDAAGRQIVVRDGNGSSTGYAYDSMGNVVIVTSPNGDESSFQYDKLGRQLIETSFEGYVTSYEYDENGNMTKVVDPVGAVTNYTYDRLNRTSTMTNILLENGSLVEYTTSYTYFGTYGIDTITYPDGIKESYTYNSLGLTASHTDRAGNETKYFYTPRLELERTIDPEGHETINAYYPSGAVKTVTRAGVVLTENIYDKLGNLRERKDPKGTTAYVYDLAGRMLKEIDKNGNETEYGYDKTGFLVWEKDAEEGETKYSYDAGGRQISETDAEGLTVFVDYDANGNILRVRDSRSTAAAALQYDKDGRAVETSDRNGNKVIYEYSPAGHLIKEQSIDMEAPKVIKVEYAYNELGYMTWMLDQALEEVTYTYDWAGNVLSEKNQLNNVERYGYDPNHNLISVTDRSGFKTEYSYDGLDQLVKVVNPEGETIEYTYDPFGNVSAIRQLQEGGAYSVTEFEHDPLGNLEKETAHLGDVAVYETDGEGNVKKAIYSNDGDDIVNQFSYDGVNRLKTAAYAGEEPVSYSYDKMGNLIKVEEEIGETLMEYDPWNRVISVTDHTGRKVGYEYDDNGNKTKMIYPDGSIVSYEYDHADRIVLSAYQKDGLSPKEIKTYIYDAKSQLKDEVYPSGEKTSYAYDLAGHLQSLTETDVNNMFRRQTTYSYMENGWLESETRTGIDVEKDKETINYHYDKSGRLLRTVKMKENGTETSRYEYDLAGNLVREVRPDKEIQYEYDLQNRLDRKVVSEDNGNVIESGYEYDQRGNLIKETAGDDVKSYVYNAAGRLTAGTNADGEESVYLYNGLGARVYHQEIRDNYNNGHQNGPVFLSSWWNSNTVSSILQEDRAHWQRIWETSTGTVVQNDRETVTKHYVPDYTSEALRDIFVVEDGSFHQSWYYDLGLTPTMLSLDYAENTERDGLSPGENPGSDIAEGITSQIWFHGNLLGSNVYGTDIDGETRFHMIYDEWGLPLIETRLDMNYHGLDNINNYTGYTYDEVLELYYAQARFYDPEVKRFVQEDLIRDGSNWYVYCGDNPITFIDLWGLADKEVTVGGTKLNSVYSDDNGVYASLRELIEVIYGGTLSAASDSSGNYTGRIKQIGMFSYIDIVFSPGTNIVTLTKKSKVTNPLFHFITHTLTYDTYTLNTINVGGTNYVDVEYFCKVLYDLGIKKDVEVKSKGFIWPVDMSKGSLTGGNGLFWQKRGERYHRGIDIGIGEGNAIYAVRDGIVLLSIPKGGDRGNYIYIDHYEGIHAVYQHNKTNLVSAGKEVNQGDIIGYTGNTGTGGYHLHFELYDFWKANIDENKYKEKIPYSYTERIGLVNPLDYLPPL